ncbi:hypothetical protein JCM19235_1237 [Vibrio maritimus]|uniref:Uncharacterized protein n=1 Tax=Vibrio maritimus TaxID=990268 RepID=A0A090S5X2_9VIBR|nr:hypothetical protein JCM19235_1237 [Vibrio maritimus]
MNNVSISTVLEKNKISSENALVFALEAQVLDPFSGSFVETVYLTNHTTDLTIEGQNYVRIPFMLDLSNEAGEVQNVSLNIEDQVGLMTPYLRQYRGLVGTQVIVKLVTVPPESTVASSVDFAEMFNVMSSSAANYVVTLELGAENPLTRACPRRTQLRDRCSHTYRSVECGYTGSMQSCDLTLNGANGCQAHNNTLRYGGSPSITVRNL